MDDVKQMERRQQIETAAFGLLALKGYKATSMLEVAKRAKASNETLYKWYGNKQGLFLSMVERNLDASRAALEKTLCGTGTLTEALDELGPQLVQMLTGQRAVVLHRAAAGDVHDTGQLGRTMTEGLRDAVAPQLAELIARHGSTVLEPLDAANIYLDLLIGDVQLRRVVGVLPLLKDEEVQARSDRARDLLLRLLG